MRTPHQHVAAFTIPSQGHVSRMLPVVAGLCEMGISVDFFAHETARRQIEQAGARFVNIYSGRDINVPDDSSLPGLIRNVSFAGYWGEDLAREVAALRPSLILHDTFAVIGRVVALHLKLPRVNMRAGHNLEPTRVLAQLQACDAVRIAEGCRTSVAVLRDRYGISDASPFSYFIDGAADLNICSEPPEFLPPDQRGPFEPLEFFGSCWPVPRRPQAMSPFGAGAESRLRVYVSFGTAAWIVCPDETMAVLEVLADAMAAIPNLRGLISLGAGQANVVNTMATFPNLPGPKNPHTKAAGLDAVAHLTRPNVRVEPYVDQNEVLSQATIFITHHGLNSTHEAIYHGVPMISYPLFDDQPTMAARCRDLRLAVPLKQAAGTIPTVADVHRALDRIQAESAAFQVRLAEAREWELAVMARRPAVLQRIVDLMQRSR